MAEKKRILVVDDERDAADGLARLLAGLGHEALATYNALEALVAANDFGPDVVILDISMPGFNGYDLLAELPKRHPHAKVVALTGLPPDQVQRHDDFDHVLTKPAGATDLAAVLGQLAGS